MKNAEMKNYLLNTKYNQVHFNVVEVDSLKHGKSLKVLRINTGEKVILSTISLNKWKY